MGETALIAFLEEMEIAVKDVQSRLLARDTAGIWTALEKQNRAVEQLSCLYKQSPGEFSGLSERNSGVRTLLRRSRSLLRANRTVAKTFLQVIDRTLLHLSGDNAAAYSGYGAGVHSSRPLLVNQQG